MSSLPAPHPVSPLIKFSRYAFLTLGIVYGLVNNSRLSAKETDFRRVEAGKKVIRDAQLAIVKAKAAEDERKAIEMLSR